LRGHEIANHTASHASFGGLTVEQQKTQIETASNLINTNVTSQKCISFAYPNCVEGSDSLCKIYFVAARGCQGVIESRTPANFMYISSIICGSEGRIQTGQNFDDEAELAASSKSWLVYLIHAIDNDPGYSPLQSTELQAGLDYLNAHREKFWVSAFGTVARYIKERNCVTVSEISADDTSIAVEVGDTLDDETYDVPITIRRLLPHNWPSAIGMQNGLPITDTIVEIDSTKYIVFDVVPDGGPVSLVKSNVAGVGASRTALPADFALGQNYPNPFNPTTIIDYRLPTSGYVKLKVYDLLGKEIGTLIDGRQRAGYHSVTFNAYNLPSGVYFYELNAGGKTYLRKMELLK
jgi:hypothetical protein